MEVALFFRISHYYFVYVNGGRVFIKMVLVFLFQAPGCKFICFVYLFVEGSGAQARIPARAVSRLSAQSSNKRVSITIDHGRIGPVSTKIAIQHVSEL